MFVVKTMKIFLFQINLQISNFNVNHYLRSFAMIRKQQRKKRGLENLSLSERNSDPDLNFSGLSFTTA